MNGWDLARTLRSLATPDGRGAVRVAWGRWRTDARDLPVRGPERARVPGPAVGAEPGPGGGVVKFTRSSPTVRVVVGGAVFCGWDGAESEPSYALADGCPEPDVRAVLEAVDDGWRVVSERLTVVVSRHGGVEFRSPGGVALRRESPPRWWDPVDGAGGEPRWSQRSVTAADARVLWAGLYAERGARGFRGVWHDGDEPVSRVAFGDPTLPLSARHALDGRGGDHRAAHNVYGLLMARAAFEGLRGPRPHQRPFVVSRSGWAGTQRYGGVWSGDAAADWEGLRASLATVLGLGLCGVPYTGPDVGGAGAVVAPELYARWFQLAAYLPLFRTSSAAGAGRREPWEFGPAVLDRARAALAERERLGPYLYTLAHLAHRVGAPYARPLWWGDPRDRGLRGVGDAFLLGDALLVAPVLRAGVVRRAVRLPRGRWYDTVSGRAYRGPGSVTLEAPPERIPVLARAGAVIPVRGEGGAVELEAWTPAPGGTGAGVLVTDAGDGWAEPVTERFTVRRGDGGFVVEGETAGHEGARRDGEAAGYPVRWRGSAS